MFNESTIKAQLYGLVGWNQPTIAAYAVVDADNLGSITGLKFDEGHSLVTVKNLKETQEDSGISTASFNSYLDKMQHSCIVDVCTKIFADKSECVENKTLFPYEQRFENTHTPGTGFVGVRVRPTINKRVSARISNISVAFDTAKTFTIYLINSQKPTKADAIATKEVTTVAGQEVKFYVNDFNIPLSTVNVSGGNYYIGYFEEDLDGAKPYKRDWEAASAPILSGDYVFPVQDKLYNVDNNAHILIDFYRVGVSGTSIVVDERTSLPDAYGLNFEYQVYNDWTDLIIQNKNLFARAIQLQMAEKSLEQIMFSSRSNLTQRLGNENIRNIAAFALNDSTSGVKSLLNTELQNLRKMFFPEHSMIIATLR